jgi:membrane protease YdiL (CAAX protease family)
MTVPPPGAARRPSTGVLSFAALACGATWLLALPAALAWLRRQAPSPLAVACAGLSAFGPLLAVLAVAGRRGELRQAFGRWRTRPAWPLVALAAPLAVHTLARALYVAVTGHAVRWLDEPRTPEALAALFVFPLGEEFGWRGFAHPRLFERLGPTRGPLVLGAVWGLWHLAYAVTPAMARFDVLEFTLTMIELPFYSVLIAWLFERANRSMLVAIAFHAGAHLDHLEPAARSDLRLAGLHVAVVALLATLAAWSLVRDVRTAGAAQGSPRPLGMPS